MPHGFEDIQIVEGAQLSDTKLNDYAVPNATPNTDQAGSPTDLWFLTLTEALVSAVGFGCKIAMRGHDTGDDVTFEIDAVRMKIYYTAEKLTLFSGSTIIGATESQVEAGGRTIILDLNILTWLTIGSAFDATRQAIIDVVNSSQSETLGWNNEIKANIQVANVVRTSDSRVTITLQAADTADYKIVADETLSLLPLAAVNHSGSNPTPAEIGVTTITAECDQTLAPDSIATQTNLSGSVTDIDESVDAPDANWLLVA